MPQSVTQMVIDTAARTYSQIMQNPLPVQRLASTTEGRHLNSPPGGT